MTAGLVLIENWARSAGREAEASDPIPSRDISICLVTNRAWIRKEDKVTCCFFHRDRLLVILFLFCRRITALCGSVDCQSCADGNACFLSHGPFFWKFFLLIYRLAQVSLAVLGGLCDNIALFSGTHHPHMPDRPC